ncbi:family 14 glycosylhydrolase [Sediminitomix flava]|uniref:Beta-amylase n=1 Tax=Sediminitomix flava TaxID=379075 RepID=A0A315ZG87_SEDFL|nr:family 14 glycosylhydrolase [Sediminitomix flava]PWJ44606.1 glycosyl hydrolase family 14 [Sediminitomix flava]
MTAPRRKTFEVTAPLSVRLYNDDTILREDDWRLFEIWTRELANMGVDAVIVPISWAKVEPEYKIEDGSVIGFKWEYYQHIAEILQNNRISFVPEFCFHFQAADVQMENFNYVKPIPEWVWGYLLSNSPELERVSDLKYVSETGDASFESLSLWADKYTIPLYRSVMESFKYTFSSMGIPIPKIMIAMGTSGELRYPSFDSHDWGGYPNRGTLQCYSNPAFKSWQYWLQAEYGTLEETNKALGQSWESWDNVSLPNEQNDIFSNRGYMNTAYGLAFSKWYNHELLSHGRRMLEMTFDVFQEGVFSRAKIGFRISGVHWKISDAVMPRAAEITSGIIAAHPDLSMSDHKEYYKSLKAIVPQEYRKRTVLHVTCIEKENKDFKGFSRAEDLSIWIANAAHKLGIRVVAENGTYGGILDNAGWNQLEKSMFDVASYDGLNISPLKAIFDDTIVKERMSRMIEQYRSQEAFVPKPQKYFRVMGPLHLSADNPRGILTYDNWREFDRHLKLLKDANVEAISIDVWWGMVQEQGPNHFNWDYYDRLIHLIQLNGLNWVPILSFHQAGGNVNDNFTQWIPVWLWGELMQKNPHLSLSDLQYVSESGDTSVEYVSLWADAYVMPYYQRFMEEFRDRYDSYANMTSEVNISMGPAGELRYPSYNAHDWGNYPNRGTLQCYSRLAVEDFQRYVKFQYSEDLDALNAQWETSYISFEEITMPRDSDSFFEKQYYFKSAMGKDLIAWYNQSLIDHGKRITKLALEVFSNESYEKVPIGFKIAGIHWNISNPQMPRVSEVTAGLIKSHDHLNGLDQREYLEMLHALVDKENKERLVVHFTCLEKYNRDYEAYSRAEDLVRWMAEAAYDLKINLAGENATPHELNSNEGWSQMERALKRVKTYNGLTILRLNDLLATEYGFNRLREMIKELG